MQSPIYQQSNESGAAARSRERGSVVTYSVAAFMLVALLVYLTVAYLADESPPSDAPERGAHPEEPH